MTPEDLAAAGRHEEALTATADRLVGWVALGIAVVALFVAVRRPATLDVVDEAERLLDHLEMRQTLRDEAQRHDG